MIKKTLRNFLAKRTIGSKLRNYSMNTFSSYDLFKKIRIDAENKRDLENRPHEVTYFHKVDDPYSHLTIQYLEKIKASYGVVLKPILVFIPKYYKLPLTFILYKINIINI